jgi:hypothetical protein
MLELSLIVQQACKYEYRIFSNLMRALFTVLVG